MKLYKIEVYKSIYYIVDLSHWDICNLNEISTWGGNRCFITLCKDTSHYLHVYLLWSKDEVVDVFKHYKAKVENQH